MDIWVIGVAYDYGIWSEAGYFETEAEAAAWIEREHSKERAQHEAYVDATGYGSKDDPVLTDWYTVKLSPNRTQPD